MSGCKFVFWAFLLMLSSCSGNAQKKGEDKASIEKARLSANGFFSVTKVVDGDTFWAEDGSGKSIKVRLTGIDAPELHNTGKKKAGYYGEEAKRYLILLLEGRKVRLEYDVGLHDRFGRTLAYVFLEDGTFVNAALIRNGYASVLTVPPNVKYADLFVNLQQKARKKRRGLWKVR